MQLEEKNKNTGKPQEEGKQSKIFLFENKIQGCKAGCPET